MSGGTFGTNWLDSTYLYTSNRYCRTYVQGFMDISGGNLIVRNNNLYLTQGDASINGNLILGYDASLNRRLFVGSDASFGARLFTRGDVSFNSRLFVGSDASINSLTVGRGGGDLSTNTVFGTNALSSNTTGSNNTAVGYKAGYAGTANTTGSNNTYVGYNTQANGAAYTNSTAIGASATITASNQVVLGTTAETVVIPNQIKHSYSSLPTFTSTSIGYTVNIDLETLAAGTGTRDTATTSMALPIGVYVCHIYYQVNITFSTTTRTYVEFRVSSGATLVNTAVMGFVYAPAVQEYNYYSLPAILVVSANPCVVFSRLTSSGGNCNITIAEIGLVRIA